MTDIIHSLHTLNPNEIREKRIFDNLMSKIKPFDARFVPDDTQIRQMINGFDKNEETQSIGGGLFRAYLAGLNLEQPEENLLRLAFNAIANPSVKGTRPFNNNDKGYTVSDIKGLLRENKTTLNNFDDLHEGSKLRKIVEKIFS